MTYVLPETLSASDITLMKQAGKTSPNENNYTFK